MKRLASLCGLRDLVGSTVRPYFALGVLLVAVLLGCVPTVGGWDVDALHSELPILGRGAPNRIGDLTPYPALVGDALALVVCRFEEASVVRVEVEGDDWPEEWSHRALEAVAFDGVRLKLTSAGDVNSAEAGPRIRVQSIAGPEALGPVGLGDTLAECDVSSAIARDAHALSPRRVTGVLREVTIRLRRRLRQQTGKVFEASEAEWGAAFLHELAHGLGFAGHVATGESVVQREQSGLRWIGRNVAEGQRIPTPNLDALYLIPNGYVLGEANVDAGAAELLRAVSQLVAERTERVGPPVGPRATAGDREARLAWRWPGGLAIALRFPDWSGELKRKEPITVEPSAATRLLLEHRRRAESL